MVYLRREPKLSHFGYIAMIKQNTWHADLQSVMTTESVQKLEKYMEYDTAISQHSQMSTCRVFPKTVWVIYGSYSIWSGFLNLHCEVFQHTM